MSVSGYASTTSVAPGESIDFYLSSDSPGSQDLNIERIGTTPVSGTISANLTNVLPAATDAWAGFGWPITTSFSVPDTWPIGLYRVSSGADELFTFIVRPPDPGTVSRVLFQIAFLTPAAYNPAGGKSLYGYNSAPGFNEASRAMRVSFDRPGNTPKSSGPEAALIRWLETEGIPIEYCSSIDLHSSPDLLGSYDCLVIAGHDEYWSKPMRETVERFVENGGNMIVLSGNTCYRAVRLEENNRVVVFCKYAGADPDNNTEEVTVAWAEPPLNRPQNSLLGVGFTQGAFNGPATAYTIRFPEHWVFSGVTGTQTTQFMTYETDGAEYLDEREGYPRVTGQESTPLSFTVLGTADLRSWTGKPGRATMGIYSRNGTVFNAATTDWILAQSGASVLGSDEIVTQVTRNVFSRLGRRVQRDWENIGRAEGGGALASVDGRLFLATTGNRLLTRHPVGADVPWRDIDHAIEVVAMAGIENTVYCVTKDNQLWWRSVEPETSWTAIGTGPAPNTRALAAAGGMLYAVDAAGALWRTPANRSLPSWAPMNFTGDPTVNAMTSYSDILFASTTDNRLLRSNTDWIAESSGWTHVHDCRMAVGLAVVQWMLFASAGDRLWRFDMYGLRQP